MAYVTVIKEETFEVDFSLNDREGVLYIIREDGETVGVPVTRAKAEELKDMGVGTCS